LNRSLADLSKVPVLAVGGTLLLSVLLMTALCLALRPLLARRLGADGPAFTSLFQGATRWQTFVALAVAGNLYGDLGLALASVAMAAMIPVLNALAVWVLARYATPARPDWRSILLAIVQNPFIWACGIGVALNPLAAWIYVLARQMGGDAPLMAQILTFQTALAAVTMPVVLSFVS